MVGNVCNTHISITPKGIAKMKKLLLTTLLVASMGAVAGNHDDEGSNGSNHHNTNVQSGSASTSNASSNGIGVGVGKSSSDSSSQTNSTVNTGGNKHRSYGDGGFSVRGDQMLKIGPFAIANTSKRAMYMQLLKHAPDARTRIEIICQMTKRKFGKKHPLTICR